MIIAAEQSSSELLLNQSSDLLQLELSYFLDGKIITFLLHVPTTIPSCQILVSNTSLQEETQC